MTPEERGKLRLRMAELAAEHQANVEAHARVTSGSDWSELQALDARGRSSP